MRAVEHKVSQEEDGGVAMSGVRDARIFTKREETLT